jgi:hypothetical protein
VTYEYDRKIGWIGFCDECKKPFQPQFIYPASRSGVMVSVNSRATCVGGYCAKCDVEEYDFSVADYLGDEETFGKLLDCWCALSDIAWIRNAIKQINKTRKHVKLSEVI